MKEAGRGAYVIFHGGRGHAHLRARVRTQSRAGGDSMIEQYGIDLVLVDHVEVVRLGFGAGQVSLVCKGAHWNQVNFM